MTTGKLDPATPPTTTPRRPGRPPTGGPGSRGGMTRQKAVRFDTATIRELERRAADAGTTVSSLVQQAVAMWLAATP